MDLKERIQAFNDLGVFMDQVISGKNRSVSSHRIHEFHELIQKQKELNPWFTPENVKFAIKAIANTLTKENLETWLTSYTEIEQDRSSKRVVVVMAGNVPLVGFHDFLSVLISGFTFVGKLSSKDNQLLPEIAEILARINPEFDNKIEFAGEKLTKFDAVIATGSNNTARYFSYHYRNHPYIIRKNRNGIAILDGKETMEELVALGDDIFRYFGLGCRSVAKLFIPEHYDFNAFFKAILPYREIINHKKYKNNYKHIRSICLVNQTPFLDTGFVLLKEDEAIASPIGVIYYQYYSDHSKLEEHLKDKAEEIQCIVDHNKILQGIKPGQAQEPALWEYADNVDTLKFLLSLIRT
ncbi:hypothetical protein ES705_27995 [subsurface metagenome]